MPGRLAHDSAERLVEFFSELARLAAADLAAAGLAAEICELFRKTLPAEAVAVFQLSADRQRVVPLAGAAMEGLMTTALPLAALPDWEEALAGGKAHWVEPSTIPVEAAVLAGRRALCLPLLRGSEPLGCLLAVFAQQASPRSFGAAEEARLAEMLATPTALLLDAAATREKLESLEARMSVRRRVAAGLLLAGLDHISLDSLLAAGIQESGAEAAALYELLPDGPSAEAGWRRRAVAGAAHLLPPLLPTDSSAQLPWERAHQEGRALLLEPAALGGGLESHLHPFRSGDLRLGVVPLPPQGGVAGLIFYCLPRGCCEQSAEAAWTCTALLAATALAEREARHSAARRAARFALLFDHLEAGAFFLDPIGLLVEANEALLRLTGYSREELRAHPLADFLSPAAEAERLNAWLRDPGAPGYATELDWRDRDGAARPVRLFLHRSREEPPEPAGLPESGSSAPLVLGLVEDMRSRQQSEERAALAQARFQGLLDSVHDGVWVLDAENRVVAANHRLAQFFGIHPQELGPGLPQWQVLEGLKLHFADAPEALAHWRELASRPPEVAWDELELLRPRRRILQRYARPLLDAEQRLVGRLEIYRDITEQRRLEDKVLQREKLATLGQLLTGIAHEINNPLTAVSGYAELLLAESPGASLREKAARLRLEAERASRIVRSLLVFARGYGAERQPVHVAEVLTLALALRAYEFKVGNIAVEREFSLDVPRVFADSTQLQQVFLNLLLNAEQAIRSQRQHGRITLRTRWDSAQARVFVEVSDDGPGIPPQVLPHIFDPFFTTKTSPEGTGLGLSISRAIVREHGGELTVRSEPGRGTTFTVVLPVHRVPARAEAPPPAPQAEAVPRPARPPRREGQRILVVDDEPVVAHLIADALRQQGHAVQVHTDSRRALALACREPFQLIICDIRMPELDGPGFHRLLAERQPALARRVLFTTGDTLARETLDFLERACLPYLPKPFHVEELRSMVSDLLQELDRPTPGSGRARPH